MIKTLLAIVAGVLNAVSFAPFNWWPLSMLSFAMLFWIWHTSSTKGATWYGFVYGLGMFGVGISWIYISIHTFGGMPPIIAGLCIFVLVAILSIFPALSGWLQSCFSAWRPTIRLAFLMPSLWILFEWLRGWLFTGLPWLSTGYAYLDTPLSNYAPIGGVYLVSLIVLVSVGTLVAIIRQITTGNSILAVLFILVWVAGWQLNKTAWTQTQGQPISVAVIQNNVALRKKWDEQEVNRIIFEYMQKSQEYRDVDLIVWPEAAIPDYLDNIANDFWRDIEDHPADFIFGVLHRDTVDDVTQYYNSAVAVTDHIMIYGKQHLVPFGEYFPFPGLLGPLTEMLNIPMSYFSAWQQPQSPLIAAENRFAVSICYEDAFPQEWRDQVESSGALINVSEDSWFGDSLAPHQRLQMARFRARESERPMIRSSNNGLSSVINWKGGIDVYAPQFVQHVVTATIQPRSGATPYVAFGENPVLILIGTWLIVGLLFGKSAERNNKLYT
ncbi:apolipoprotein N-acyltransferase [Candidatus Spongiihabitans sp.]|uniref:apolipoprotein N-acyltransferase n=1 Tax=Candidatus Spongiihabitans sp. TaxID=3101308 RepID=UPI003C6F0B56